MSDRYPVSFERTARDWRAGASSGVLLAALLFSPAGGQQVSMQDLTEAGLARTALERIAPAMQVYVDSGQVAGMVLMVARRGRIAYTGSVGYADIENRVPLESEAVFRLASMRKPLLAAATMALVDADMLRLDDPVSMYIPSFARVQRYAGGSWQAPLLERPARPITVRHLLTHTSGLAAGYFHHPVDSIYRRVVPGASLTLAEYADQLAAIPLEFSPGDQWRYSRSFEVIGALIEAVSGQSLNEVLWERLLTPLGAEATYVEPTVEIGRRLPVMYYRSGGQLRPSSDARRSRSLPTGTMVSTPVDYIRFGQMLLNGGTLDGRRVLSKESVAELLRNQLPPSLTPISTPVWDHEGYGFSLGGGVLVDSTIPEGHALPGTYRWAGSTGTFFWVDPEAELVALVWTQSASGYWLEHHFERLVYDAVIP